MTTPPAASSTPRKIHLVGTIPADDDEAAMKWALDQTRQGSLLHTLPTGETGPRKNWIVGLIESMREHPDLRLSADGQWTSYTDLPSFEIKPGHRLDADSLNLKYADYTAATWETFQRVRASAGRGDLPMQVSIPGDFDMALFTLGPVEGMRHLPIFTDATLRDISRIQESFGRETVFQIEVPAELGAVAMESGTEQRAVAERLAAGIVRLARQAPEGSRFGVHLCVGDLNNKARGRLRDATPLVAMCDALVAGWPEGRSLEFVHAPLAAGDSPPSVDESWYEPLRQVRLPESTRFVAGLVHESPTVTDLDLKRLLNLVEGHLGRRVDVAAACGLGRRTPEAATELMRRARELVDS